MRDARALARLWAGRSVFLDKDAPRDTSSFPFALVAASAAAGRDVGSAPAGLLARPALGLRGMPALRVPILLNASDLQEGGPKGWAALARGASAAGVSLLITPAQLKAREAVLKAAGVPLVLRVAPGEPLAPSDAAACAALAPALASSDGAPAVLAEDALPGLVEALRAITEYRAPVVPLVPPGRGPSSATLRAAAAAGAVALAFAEGEGPARLPLAALTGVALALRASGLGLGAFLLTDEVADGVELACALAAGGGLLATALPVRLAFEAEAATDADWKTTGDRLAGALRVLWQDAQRASSQAGVRDPRDLSADNLRALSYDAAALSGVKLAGFGERLPWWTH